MTDLGMPLDPFPEDSTGNVYELSFDGDDGGWLVLSRRGEAVLKIKPDSSMAWRLYNYFKNDPGLWLQFSHNMVQVLGTADEWLREVVRQVALAVEQGNAFESKFTVTMRPWRGEAEDVSVSTSHERLKQHATNEAEIRRIAGAIRDLLPIKPEVIGLVFDPSTRDMPRLATQTHGSAVRYRDLNKLFDPQHCRIIGEFCTTLSGLMESVEQLAELEMMLRYNVVRHERTQLLVLARV